MEIKTVTQKDARDLAVRYNAYLEAIYNWDRVGIRVWGEALKLSQAATGITLTSSSLIDRCIASSAKYEKRPTEDHNRREPIQDEHGDLVDYD